MAADDESREADAVAEPRWTWNHGQRRVLAALILVLSAAFTVRYAFNRAYVPDPQPPHGPRYDEVADKLDPNTADAASLSALPLIGEKRAQDLVDFRESHRTVAGTQPVFRSADDLLRIKGFGRATVETLRPYLSFPADDLATTQP